MLSSSYTTRLLECDFLDFYKNPDRKHSVNDYLHWVNQSMQQSKVVVSSTVHTWQVGAVFVQAVSDIRVTFSSVSVPGALQLKSI